MTNYARAVNLMQELRARIEAIDLCLQRCNRILMAAQPKKVGKITLYWSPSKAESDELGIIAQPARPVRWMQNPVGQWYLRPLPITNLRQNAKGKGKFSTGYSVTAGTLSQVGMLLKLRRECRSVFGQLQRKCLKLNTDAEVLTHQTMDLMESYFIEHQRRREARLPSEAEWNWFHDPKAAWPVSPEKARRDLEDGTWPHAESPSVVYGLDDDDDDY